MSSPRTDRPQSCTVGAPQQAGAMSNRATERPARAPVPHAELARGRPHLPLRVVRVVGRRAAVVAAGATVVVGAAACSSSSPPTPAPTVTVTSSTTTTRPAATSPANSTAPPTSAPTASTAPPPTSVNTGVSNRSPGLCTPTVATFTVASLPGGGAGGHDGFLVQVRNASATTCNTTGYPGVALLDSTGRQLEQARRTPAGFLGGLQSGQPSPQIALQPGQLATARIEYDTSINGGRCPTAVALLFTLPDNTDSARLSRRVLACPGGLQVHPLLPGATGTQA